MAYSEQLKAAQRAKLKQRYLDLITEAGRKKDSEMESADKRRRDLYTEMMTAIKDLPQQLAAAGQNGGAGEDQLRSIRLAYEQGLNDIKQQNDQMMAKYNYEIEKQLRLMQLALDELDLRGSGSSKKSPSTGKPAAASDKGDTKDEGETVAMGSRRSSPYIIESFPASGGNGWRFMENK